MLPLALWLATVAVGQTPNPVEMASQARALPGSPRAYLVDADTGLSFTAHGPTFILLQVRTKVQRSKTLIDITRDDRYVSRNQVRFRRLRGVAGYDYVTLLSLKVPEGDHQYRISGNGVAFVAIVDVTPSFAKPFAAAAEEDTRAVAQAEQPITPTNPPPGDTTPPPTDQTAPGDTGDISYDLGDLGTEPATVSSTSSSALQVPLSESAILSKLDQADDALAIGGQLFPRFFYNNVEPRSAATKEHQVVQSNLVDVYFDARPADQLRGYFRVRLINSQGLTRGAPDNNIFVLDQLWLKWSIARTLFITLGKQPVRWGVGYFWNPSDILNPTKRDPLAPFDQRTGLGLLKLHMPIESLGWNFYAILDLQGLDEPQRVPVVTRGEFVLGLAELTVTGLFAKGRHPLLTSTLNAGFWIFDFKGEIATSQGPIQPRWRGPFEPENGIIPVRESTGDTWRIQASAALEMTLKYVTNDAKVAEDQVIIGVEVYHNDDGYNELTKLAWLQAQGEFNSIYSGRDYAGVYIVVPKPGSWDETTFALSGITNLRDRSWFTRFDYRVSLMRYLALSAAAIYHGGDIGSLRMGYDLPAVDAPGFTEGRELPTERFELQLGLQIAL
ncbi:MAG: hypothetical protein ACAI38_17945 [Myxococcota bacterium]